MADIFLQEDITKLLKGKRIVFFGDSNMRRLYKDVVWLLNDNTLISNKSIDKKGEYNYRGDRLITQSALTRGRDYEENRRYTVDDFDIEYFFITRCINKQIREYIINIKNGKLQAPDVMVMNSTFWDITRWGPNGVQQFQNDLVDLMKFLKSCLPDSTMVIWTTALPPGENIWKRSLLVKQVEFLGHTLRFDVMEANLYARSVVVEFGFDVLDFHFHLRLQLQRRCRDGVHYKPLVVRLLTNVLLTHIALSWGHPLPKNVKNNLLDRYENMVLDNDNDVNLIDVSDQNVNDSSLKSCGSVIRDISYNANYDQIKIVIKNENNTHEKDMSNLNKPTMNETVQTPPENFNEFLLNRVKTNDNMNSKGIHVVIKNDNNNNNNNDTREISNSERFVINNELNRKRKRSKRKRKKTCTVDKTLQNEKVKPKEQNKKNKKSTGMRKRNWSRPQSYRRRKKCMNNISSSYNRNYSSCNSMNQIRNSGMQIWQNNGVQVWENNVSPLENYSGRNNNLFLNDGISSYDSNYTSFNTMFDHTYNNSYQMTRIQNNDTQVWQNNGAQLWKTNESRLENNSGSNNNNIFLNDTGDSYDSNYRYAFCNTMFNHNYNNSFQTTKIENNDAQLSQNNGVPVWETVVARLQKNSGVSSCNSNNHVFLNDTSGSYDGNYFSCNAMFNRDRNDSYQKTQVQNSGVHIWQTNLSDMACNSAYNNDILLNSPTLQSRKFIHYDLDNRANRRMERQSAKVIPFYSSKLQKFIDPRYSRFL